MTTQTARRRSPKEIDHERLMRSARILWREVHLVVADGIKAEDAWEWLVESSRERGDIEFGDSTSWSDAMGDRVMDWRSALEALVEPELAVGLGLPEGTSLESLRTPVWNAPESSAEPAAVMDRQEMIEALLNLGLIDEPRAGELADYCDAQVAVIYWDLMGDDDDRAADRLAENLRRGEDVAAFAGAARAELDESASWTDPGMDEPDETLVAYAEQRAEISGRAFADELDLFLACSVREHVADYAELESLFAATPELSGEIVAGCADALRLELDALLAGVELDDDDAPIFANDADQDRFDELVFTLQAGLAAELDAEDAIERDHRAAEFVRLAARDAELDRIPSAIPF